MCHDKSSDHLPAPCIIESGTIVNKEDIRRLLSDLKRVRYIHTLDNSLQNEGEGWIQEVFADPLQATLIANGSLYINICSFDYLHLSKSPEQETYMDLIQENRQLRLIPLSNFLQDSQTGANIDPATLEAMVAQVLSARWDVQFDDDSFS